MSSCLVGCRASPALRHAKDRNLSALRKDLASHPPTPNQARQVAQEVLKYEIENAADPKDRGFLKTIVGCSLGMTESLRRRAKLRDGAGAEAAMVLVELGKWGNVSAFETDDDGAWRALAARGTGTDPVLRRDYYVDPDERVRQAALRAALLEPSQEDVSSLLEVARLDPDPVTRSRAILALGHIEDERISRALFDLYPRLDESLRLTVVDACGTQPLYQHGGQGKLERLISHDNGLPVVAAASRLARDSDEAVSNPAIARLLRFLTEGTTDEQRLTLTTMPVTHLETTKALLGKTGSSDPSIAVIAWSRLLAHEDHRAKAERELATLSKVQEDPSLALQAQAALAAGGSARVIAQLTEQLRDGNPTVRKLSALGLIRLGQLALASRLVADEDESVRRAIACRVVGAPLLPLSE